MILGWKLHFSGLNENAGSRRETIESLLLSHSPSHVLYPLAPLASYAQFNFLINYTNRHLWDFRLTGFPFLFLSLRIYSPAGQFQRPLRDHYWNQRLTAHVKNLLPTDVYLFIWWLLMIYYWKISKILMEFFLWVCLWDKLSWVLPPMLQINIRQPSPGQEIFTMHKRKLRKNHNKF